MNTKTEIDYVGSLEAFLKSTHEDKLDVDGIIKQISKYAPWFWQEKDNPWRMRILDVGSGNGQKSLGLAREFHDEHMSRPQIDFIEPDDKQRLKLFENIIKTNDIGRYEALVFSYDFEHFLPYGTEKYDIILFLHSLYQFPKNGEGIILGIEKTKDLLKENGCVITILEDYDSDLQRMKRELYLKFGRKNLVSIEDVKKSFESFGMSVREGDKIPIKYYFNEKDNELEIGKNLDFLFSTGIRDKGLSVEQYAHVGNWVRNNCSYDKNGSYLNIPNAVLWVYK